VAGFFTQIIFQNLAKKIFAGKPRKSEADNQDRMGQIKLIAGLGNPGKEYERTRHNIGFKVIDSLAEFLGIDVRSKKFGGLVGQGEFEGIKLMLLKPQEYMNRSGQAVATMAGFYKIAIGDILVIADDMALEPGVIRIRAKGSAGGHNGLADIVNKLGSDEFARLRIGIGKSPWPDARDYVLGVPGADDQALLDKAIPRGRQTALCWLSEGVEMAMNKFNAKGQ
jgi:peptidyl-tRNA hydrolase, PTH1 family